MACFLDHGSTGVESDALIMHVITRYICVVQLLHVYDHHGSECCNHNKRYIQGTA